jgi:hypothetical protein
VEGAVKRLKPDERCPTCGIEPRTLDVQLGTYKRRGGNFGWRIRVTDPNGDAEVEAKAAGDIAGILLAVYKDLATKLGSPSSSKVEST